MKLAIIIPAHNEEKRIGRTLERYGRLFAEKKKSKEIEDFRMIVVINNTQDKTAEIVKKLKKNYREIEYLNFKQGGKGFALIEGFNEALKKKFDLIGFVDADMSTSPEEYFKLVDGIGDYDAIIASRYLKGAVVSPKQPFKRIIVSRIGNLIIRILFFMPYHDTQLGAKLLKREAVSKIIDKLGVTNWAFDIDLLYQLRKQDFKIKEFPTVWKDELGSKLNLDKATKQVFFAVIQLRILNSPLKRMWRIIAPFAGYLWRAIR